MAEKWSHNTMVEVVWTTIPVIILIGLPSGHARAGVARHHHRPADDGKVTGFQWKWRYDYVSYLGKLVDKVGFMSKLDDSATARASSIRA